MATIDDYNALKAALERGARKVKQGEEEVEYASASEMRRILRSMADELGLTTGRKAIKPKYPTAGRGL